jgi:hypothetical protein
MLQLPGKRADDRLAAAARHPLIHGVMDGANERLGGGNEWRQSAVWTGFQELKDYRVSGEKIGSKGNHLSYVIWHLSFVICHFPAVKRLR